MARTPALFAALAAASLIGVPAQGATVRSLPSVERTVTTLQTTDRCRDGARTPRGAVDVVWRARTASALQARSLGSRRAGDWDLLALDAEGRPVDAARGVGAREAVQAVATAGERVTVRACRRAGAAPRLRLRLESVALSGAPRAVEKVSLVEVKTRTRADAQRLVDAGFDVGEDGHGSDISVVVHGAAEEAALRRLGLPFSVQVDDLVAKDRRDRAAEAARTTPSLLPSGRTDYRTYEEIQAELKTLAGKHPDIARAFAMPLTTSQGREISGIEIAAPLAGADRDGRPTFLLMGVHHAREWPAGEIAMEHVNDLLASRDDPQTKALLERARIIVVPIQNPDGYTWSRGGVGDVDKENGSLVYGAATDIQAYRRRTCSGVLPPAAPCDLQFGADSNRNYGPNWGGTGSSTIQTDPTYRGDTFWSESETEAVHQLLQKTNATLVVSLHTVLGAVLRPPGMEADFPVPEDAQMEAVGAPMADATGYQNTTFFQGLGYDGSGITEDWSYGSLGSYTFTFELAGEGFHGEYARNVEQQWVGPEGAGGMRAALRHALASAIETAHHSRVEVRSQPGATLRLDKAFKEQTREACTVAGGLVAPGCVGVMDTIEFDEKVGFEMTVPASGIATWHVPPSTRPFERRDGKTESYTLTCARGGSVLDTKTVTVDRGQAVSVDCAPAPPAAAPAAKAKQKPALKCRKGYAKKKVRGKSRCVKKKKRPSRRR